MARRTHRGIVLTGKPLPASVPASTIHPAKPTPKGDPVAAALRMAVGCLDLGDDREAERIVRAAHEALAARLRARDANNAQRTTVRWLEQEMQAACEVEAT